MRAALLLLFAHFEASINDVIYRSAIANFNLRKNNQDKCDLVADRSDIRSPAIAELRKIRNILVHPGGKNADSLVFENHTIPFIEDFGNSISGWLDAVCESLGVARFTDTGDFVSDLANRLGRNNGIAEI